MYDLLVYFNFVLSFIAGTIYLRNFIRCKEFWKWLKFMHMFTLYVVAAIYTMYALKIPVDPIFVRLNTTILVILFGVDGFLGRSKYGKRS